MTSKTTKTYDLQRTFLRSIIVGDIANPLPSFDSHTPAKQAFQALSHIDEKIAGVRVNGMVVGYLIRDELLILAQVTKVWSDWPHGKGQNDKLERRTPQASLGFIPDRLEAKGHCRSSRRDPRCR
jgi:hypothetical protein